MYLHRLVINSTTIYMTRSDDARHLNRTYIARQSGNVVNPSHKVDSTARDYIVLSRRNNADCGDQVSLRMRHYSRSSACRVA